MNNEPWNEMSKQWAEFCRGQAPSPASSWPDDHGKSTASTGLTDQFANTTALAELWRSWMSFGGRLPTGGTVPAGGVPGALSESLSPSLARSGDVSDTLRRMVDGPRLADAGATERLMARVMQRWEAVQQSTFAYEAVVAAAWTEANSRFAQDISSRYRSEKRAPDAKEGLRLWLDITNQVLLETHRSDKFLEIQRQLLRDGLEFMLVERELIEGLAEPAGLPTRTEIDEVHRSVHELKRRVRGLERAAAAQRQHDRTASKSVVPSSEPVAQPRAKRAASSSAPSADEPCALSTSTSRRPRDKAAPASRHRKAAASVTEAPKASPMKRTRKSTSTAAQARRPRTATKRDEQK